MINEIPAKTISLPDSSLNLTFGKVGGWLIVAGNPESFSKVTDVMNGKKTSLAQNSSLQTALKNYQKQSFLNFYLALKNLNNFGLENLKSASKGYLKLHLGTEFESLWERLSKLNWLLFVVEERNQVQGELRYN